MKMFYRPFKQHKKRHFNISRLYLMIQKSGWRTMVAIDDLEIKTKTKRKMNSVVIHALAQCQDILLKYRVEKEGNH